MNVDFNLWWWSLAEGAKVHTFFISVEVQILVGKKRTLVKVKVLTQLFYLNKSNEVLTQYVHSSKDYNIQVLKCT